MEAYRRLEDLVVYPIAAGPDRAYGKMAIALVDYLNPELPNPET